MFKFFILSLSFLISTNAMAATGTGHSQAELAAPLSLTHNRDVNFGTIAIDPAAGAQTVSINGSGVTCPSIYVCSGSAIYGELLVQGAPNTQIYTSLVGSTAVLSDGSGNTIIFDPDVVSLGNDSYNPQLPGGGLMAFSIFGTIDFTGTEPAGTYSSSNPGGTGYVMTVNY